MILCGIVAAADNGLIGIDNQLPWKISEDLKHFKRLTSGHVILMGRKTFDSLGRALPNRTNIVITRSRDFSADSVIVMNSLEAGLERAKSLSKPEEEVFVIGGSEIYKQSFSMIEKFYLTQVHLELKGDAYFPMDQFFREFEILSCERHSQDEPQKLEYSFIEARRQTSK